MALNFSLKTENYLPEIIKKETERQENEARRIANENGRNLNEDTRIANENIRISQEEAREAAETLRAGAETVRVNSESQRILILNQLQTEIENTINDLQNKVESGYFKGEPGEPGYTPVKGTDYYTDAEQQQLVEDITESVSENIGLTIDTINGEVV